MSDCCWCKRAREPLVGSLATPAAGRRPRAPFFHATRIPVSARTSQAWLRWFNSAFASRLFRVANFDSEVPALNRRELGANPRRPTISASVVKLLSSSASNGEFAGGSPAGCTNSCRVSPTTRDAPLRPERLGVELPHAAPFHGDWLQREQRLKIAEPSGCKSRVADQPSFPELRLGEPACG